MKIVSNLLGVEMLRDGGSLSVSFVDQSGNETWLVFPIQTRKLEPGKLEILGYSTPRFVCRHLDIELEATWNESLVFLRSLRSNHETVPYEALLNQMEDIANSEGKLPPGIKRVSDTLRSSV